MQFSHKRNTTITVDAHVGQKLKLRRTLLGLSQAQLGKSLGITFQQIQKYEKGSNSMNAGRLCNVAEFLKVPVSYFFEGLEETDLQYKPDKMAGLGHNLQPSDREMLEIMKAFNYLKEPALRKRMTDLIRAIVDTN